MSTIALSSPLLSSSSAHAAATTTRRARLFKLKARIRLALGRW